MAKRKASKTEYNRIKDVLDAKGMTVSDLGVHIKKSRVVVSNYVHNNTQPSIKVLFKIAQVLHVSPKDLLNEISI
jgi:transcriptional regulator with XRE-family HTH domain